MLDHVYKKHGFLPYDHLKYKNVEKAVRYERKLLKNFFTEDAVYY
jgi:hypothetical protein